MTPQQLKKVIPLSLHGDEVPGTGVVKQWSRKIVNFSWYSLLSTTASVKDSQLFHLGSFRTKQDLLRNNKLGIVHCGVFFEVLAWSLEFLFKGIYPTHDVKGREQLSSIFVQLLRLICCCFVLRDLGVKANLILRAVEVFCLGYFWLFRLLLALSSRL